MSKPSSGTSTPNRVVFGLADSLVKNPPNNLNLLDPSEQFRANDLLGARGTEAIADAPSEEEMSRVQALADKLNQRLKQ